MRFRSSVAALAAVGALAAVADAQTVRSPSSSEARLYAQLMAMTDSRTFDRSLVDSALATSWAPLRAAAALSVGQVGASHGMRGAPLLRSLLTDADNTVASNAAYALGLLRDSTAVPALATALKGSPRVARESAWALGEIGAPARSAIGAGLASPGADEGRMIQLLLAAAKLRPVPVAEVRPYLAMASQPSVLYAASYAIARVRSPDGVRDLIAIATNPGFVRVSATEAKAGIGAPRSLSPSFNPTAEAYVLPGAGRQRARAE
ncbi:MAG TPA: HEAT repeat domain-containing protein, partial [Gemmatimonadaceae bacterium]|nr:HEAT repeat domain-containing protein [Gemmatimonadaceae bacterium]